MGITIKPTAGNVVLIQDESGNCVIEIYSIRNKILVKVLKGSQVTTNHRRRALSVTDTED